MLPEERRKEILIKLREKEIYQIKDIVVDFHVSRITILRDIEKLRKQNLLEKIHGGIKLNYGDNRNSSDFAVSFSIRIRENYEKKVEIAKKALEFAQSRSSIFLDSSSTVFVFASELFKRYYPEQNIITNSPKIITEALKYPAVSLISTGGELRQDFNIFGGRWVNEFLEKVNINIAFISTAGVSADGKITTSNKELAEISNTIFNKNAEINLLIDSTKFCKAGMLNIADINECKRIITDKNISESTVQKIRALYKNELVF